eukprot:s9006_g1.t1
MMKATQETLYTPNIEDLLAEEGEARMMKATQETLYTPNIEDLLAAVSPENPLKVTHTVDPREVLPVVERWVPAMKAELNSLEQMPAIKKHRGCEAAALRRDPQLVVVPSKLVFTVKPGVLPGLSKGEGKELLALLGIDDRLSTAIHGLHGFQAALHALLAQLIWGYDSRHLSSFAASLSGMRKIQSPSGYCFGEIKTMDYRPTALDLQRWDEGGWRTVATFNAVLGGLLQLSPSWGQPQTRFVVGNSQPTVAGWKHVKICTGSFHLSTDEHFLGKGDSADADGALDGNLDSLWFANCCNMHGDFLMAGCSGCQAGEAWAPPQQRNLVALCGCFVEWIYPTYGKDLPVTA